MPLSQDITFVHTTAMMVNCQGHFQTLFWCRPVWRHGLTGLSLRCVVFIQAAGGSEQCTGGSQWGPESGWRPSSEIGAEAGARPCQTCHNDGNMTRHVWKHLFPYGNRMLYNGKSEIEFFRVIALDYHPTDRILVCGYQFSLLNLTLFRASGNSQDWAFIWSSPQVGVIPGPHL